MAKSVVVVVAIVVVVAEVKMSVMNVASALKVMYPIHL
jgi:hypothetical protein